MIELAKVELSGSNVRMHPVLARPISFEGAEKSSLGDVEGGSLEISAVDRGLHAGNVVGLADIHRELAEVQHHVFVASDIADLEFSGHHADVKIRRLRDFYRDAKVVVRASRDLNVGVIA